MPITIFYLFLSQMMLFGIIRVYENQLYLYRLTENHYKAQTLLAYTDHWLKEHNKISSPENRIVPASLYFEEGIVHCVADASGKVTATVTLQNAYSETLVLEILSPE
ncbi:hypothetical protein [Trichococcus flocculiformis]|uniref:hypothetical protein n=1 Tax=Trichococcus flocculiformis TaxID=82803 RepID=UPI002AAAB8B7|nr:hypothetical protein [Trichococcus flocculiformis]